MHYQNNNNNEPEETSPRGLSGRKKRQNLKFMSERYPQDKINYTSPEYVWPIPSEIDVRIFLWWYFALCFVGEGVILSRFSVEMLLTQEKQWRRDSSAMSRSFVVSFLTQRTPQTKTNITETTDGFTDGTRSRRRWDFDEFKGFIFFNSIWTIVFYIHPKTDFWGEIASIEWSFEIGPKRLCT